MGTENFIRHWTLTGEGAEGCLPSGIESANIGTHIRLNAPDMHERNNILVRNVLGIFPMLKGWLN